MGAMFLYDADCGFCTRCARTLRRLSGQGRYDVVALQSVAPATVGLTADQFASASWFVAADGTARSGREGIARALLAGRRGLRPLGAALRLPGVRRIGDLAYTWIAANRHRLPGSTCPVPRPR